VKEDFLDPAIEGNLGLLRAVAKTPTIKRVAITSSVAAVMSASTGMCTEKTNKKREEKKLIPIRSKPRSQPHLY